MLTDLPFILSIFLTTIIFCVIIYILMIIKIKSFKRTIDILMKNYNCFNLKVAYDIIMLDRAQVMINNLDPEIKSEIIKAIVYCQQSINCDDIIANIKKINKEEDDFNVKNNCT